jgi:phosphopantothenoylcysteine decarboxylase/phosphopantothenate--cysteine ligase
MRILVTAGPTREPLDAVRFITNASSGRMGCAVAAAALAAGHDVRLLLGPCGAEPPGGAEVVRFATAADLKRELHARFAACDALVMAAAVGDFTPEAPADGKLRRSDGPLELRLVPTEDILAGVAAGRRAGQTVVAFAVEAGDEEEMASAARRKLAAKGADFIVVNPASAMGAAAGRAAILTADAVALPWAERGKEALAAEILRLLERSGGNPI